MELLLCSKNFIPAPEWNRAARTTRAARASWKHTPNYNNCAQLRSVSALTFALAESAFEMAQDE